CLDFFFPTPPTPDIYTLSLHDALPISPFTCPKSSLSNRVSTTAQQFTTTRFPDEAGLNLCSACATRSLPAPVGPVIKTVLKCGRSEEHTSELQSQSNLVCRLLLEKKK